MSKPAHRKCGSFFCVFFGISLGKLYKHCANGRRDFKFGRHVQFLTEFRLIYGWLMTSHFQGQITLHFFLGPNWLVISTYFMFQFWGGNKNVADEQAYKVLF